MEVMTPLVEELKNKLRILQQSMADSEEKLHELEKLVAKQEEGYDSIVRAVRSNEAEFSEGLEYLASKKTEFEHTGILQSAIDQMASDSNSIFQQQIFDIEEMKVLCKSEYSEHCAEKDTLEDTIKKFWREIQELLKQIRAIAAEVIE